LVRGAFLWLTIASALTIYFGSASAVDGTLVGQFELDAVRHSLGAGVITSLIAGMSIMILPEFAQERQRPNRQAFLAFSLLVLINGAALCRVLPALFGEDWTEDQRNLSMSVAGTLAELAVLLLAISLFRLLRRGDLAH
jgi:hypothetical protein